MNQHFKNIDGRIKIRKKAICVFYVIFPFFFCVCPAWSATESMDLNSYYPAPFGSYRMCCLVPQDSPPGLCTDAHMKGTLYVDKTTGKVMFCGDTGTWVEITGDTTPTSNDIWGLNTSPTYVYSKPDSTVLNDNHYIGIGTSTPNYRMTLTQDGGIIAEGTHGAGAAIPDVSGFECINQIDNRFIWNPRKATFRVGFPHASACTWWNDVNVGNYTVASGADTFAKGDYSMAMGYRAYTDAHNGIAMGWYPKATRATIPGDPAAAAPVAIGNSPYAQGDGAVALSVGPSVNFGFTWDKGARAQDTNGVAIGYNAITNDGVSIGNNVTTSGTTNLTLGTSITGSGIGLQYTAAPYAPSSFAIMGGKVGIQTATPAFTLTVEGDGGILAMGEGAGTSTLPNGAEAYMALTSTNFSAGPNFAAGISGYGFFVGPGSSVGNYGTAIGQSAVTTSPSYSTAFGNTSRAQAVGSTALAGAQAASSSSIAIGQSSLAESTYSGFMAIGQIAKARRTKCIAIGHNITCGPSAGQRSIAISLSSAVTSVNTDSVMFFLNGKVGIGTLTPGSNLAVLGITGIASMTNMNYLKINFTTGEIYGQTSLKKYKRKIRPLKENWYKILDLAPQSFIDAASHKKEVGVVAEDVDKIGLRKLVLNDDSGDIQGFQYEKVPLYMLMVVKDQQRRIHELKSAVCPRHPDTEVCR